MPRAPDQAARLYRTAAKQGNAMAQYRLGMMLRGGDGVAQNEAEAQEWLNKAAKQGYRPVVAAVKQQRG